MPYPSKRSDALVESILSRVADGETLAEICREEDKPSAQAWYNWCNEDQSLAIAYARARELGEEVIASDCLVIADDGRNDWMEQHDKDGALIGWRVNGEHISRSKLRVDTRLKLLAKWNPKRWGDRVDVTSGGESLPSQDQSILELARLVAFALSKAEKIVDKGVTIEQEG